MTIQDLDFDAALARLTRWRVLLFAVWAGAVPAELTVGSPLSERLGSSVPFFAIAGIAMIVFVYCGVRIGLFRCPRCNNRYTSRRYRGILLYNNPFASQCLHCGLKRAI